MMVKTGYFPIKTHWIDLFILKLRLLLLIFYLYLELNEASKAMHKVVMKMPLCFSSVLMITLFMRFASKKMKHSTLFPYEDVVKIECAKNVAMNNCRVVRKIKIFVASTRISRESMFCSQCFILHTSRSALVSKDLRSSACMYCFYVKQSHTSLLPKKRKKRGNWFAYQNSAGIFHFAIDI